MLFCQLVLLAVAAAVVAAVTASAAAPTVSDTALPNMANQRKRKRNKSFGLTCACFFGMVFAAPQ